MSTNAAFIRPQGFILCRFNKWREPGVWFAAVLSPLPVCFTHVNRTRVAVETVDEWFYLFSCILRASRHFITVGWAAHKRAQEQWERQQLQNLNSLVCKQIVLVINIHKQISVAVHFIYVFYVVRCLYSAASSLFYMRLAQSLESEPCLVATLSNKT